MQRIAKAVEDKLNWTASVGAYDIRSLIRAKWMLDFTCEHRGYECRELEIKTNDAPEHVTFARIIDRISKLINRSMYRLEANNAFCDELWVDFSQNGSQASVDLYGTLEMVEALHAALKEESQPTITFYYHDNGLRSRNFEIKKANTIKDCYYPFIEKGVLSELDSFMKSDEPVLFMLGPPGTGKTTLLRYFLYQANVKARVTFDETVMKSDSFYLDFMLNSDQDVLVVEDCDVIVSTRKRDMNPVVSKLLNYSDGIIKLKKKKLVFSSNLENAGDVDSALVRPGRCYAFWKFRKLTLAESNVVRSDLGREPFVNGDEYSLAEIFYSKSDPKLGQRVGF